MNTVGALKDNGIAQYQLSRFVGGIDDNVILNRIFKGRFFVKE